MALLFCPVMPHLNRGMAALGLEMCWRSMIWPAGLLWCCGRKKVGNGEHFSRACNGRYRIICTTNCEVYRYAYNRCSFFGVANKNNRAAHKDILFVILPGRLVEPPVFPSGARFADTHTHLDMLHYPSLALARCAAHGVDFLVTVVDPTEDPGYTYDNLDVWLQTARVQLDEWGLHSHQLPMTEIIIGCHPHNASAFDSSTQTLLVELLQQPKTAAVGEIGLDYHYDYSPRGVQQQVFREQIRLAKTQGLSISLHLREAHEDGLNILRQEGLPEAGALLHCFNLDYATLEPFLELGCKVAFGGPLTFKKSDDVRQAAARTAWDKIMTETDATLHGAAPA